MPRLTVTVSDDQAEQIEELAESDEYDSKSEVVRDFIDDALRVQELETTVERLRNEKRTLIQNYQQHNALVKYVEEQQEIQDQPLLTRAKWRVFGRPEEISASGEE